MIMTGANPTVLRHLCSFWRATAPPFERPEGSIIKIRFTPDADEPAWKQLGSERSQALGQTQQCKSLEDKLDLLGEIVYSHCLSQLGSERKEVTSPQKTMRQVWIGVLKTLKKAARRDSMQQMITKERISGNMARA